MTVPLIDASTVNPALHQAVWAKQLWAEAQEKIYWKKFISKTEPTLDKMETDAFNNIFTEKADLSKKKGDKITIGIAMKLNDGPTVGDRLLIGNEEEITYYEDEVEVDQYRHAVALPGAMEEQRFAYTSRLTAKSLLGAWGREYMDYSMFYVLSRNPSATRRLYGGDATSWGELDNTCVFNTEIISRARRFAEMQDPIIRPVIVDGQPRWVCVIHPYQAKSLVADAAWKEAQQTANIRGEKNPIFSGALGIWDNVVIHTHRQILYSSYGGGTGTETGPMSDFNPWDSTKTGTTAVTGEVAMARALFLGAQAGLKAVAKPMFWREENQDYGNRTGFATGLIWGVKKTVFNGVDYATIALDTAVIPD